MLDLKEVISSWFGAVDGLVPDIFGVLNLIRPSVQVTGGVEIKICKTLDLF